MTFPAMFAVHQLSLSWYQVALIYADNNGKLQTFRKDLIAGTATMSCTWHEQRTWIESKAIVLLPISITVIWRSLNNWFPETNDKLKTHASFYV